MAPMNHRGSVEVTYSNMRFLITLSNQHNLKFIEELKKYGVTTIVVLSEATQDTALVEKEGNHVLDWPFNDDSSLTNPFVDDWLSLVSIKFHEEPGSCIAVSCVAGLRRSPAPVALALVKGGMKNGDAIQ